MGPAEFSQRERERDGTSRVQPERERERDGTSRVQPERERERERWDQQSSAREREMGPAEFSQRERDGTSRVQPKRERWDQQSSARERERERERRPKRGTTLVPADKTRPTPWLLGDQHLEVSSLPPVVCYNLSLETDYIRQIHREIRVSKEKFLLK
jgi:hypothetical protein